MTDTRLTFLICDLREMEGRLRRTYRSLWYKVLGFLSVRRRAQIVGLVDAIIGFISELILSLSISRPSNNNKPVTPSEKDCRWSFFRFRDYLLFAKLD
jgi:hypothetical protein